MFSEETEKYFSKVENIKHELFANSEKININYKLYVFIFDNIIGQTQNIKNKVNDFLTEHFYENVNFMVLGISNNHLSILSPPVHLNLVNLDLLNHCFYHDSNYSFAFESEWNELIDSLINKTFVNGMISLIFYDGDIEIIFVNN